ncbi:soluble quino protein glucose dehydrogenase, partial [Westerdykella ornata]
INHGIALSADGKTLYASGADGVWAWAYDPSTGRNTSRPTQVIGDFGPTDGHVTRTLLMSRKAEGMLLVSRGSTSNVDPAALDASTGVSTIKAFNVSEKPAPDSQPYSFRNDGKLLGWGLRNSVGIAEEPVTGGIYSMENSVDDMERLGRDIHRDNPGEELNFHGYLNGTQTKEQGGNFGYPECYAAWNVGAIPENDGRIKVGTQFAMGSLNGSVDDEYCRREKVAPRLTFAAHMAPLDVKFNRDGSAAWVTFHGSWNRDAPVGYKLSVIPFANGSPTDPPDSTTAAVDIVSNRDVSRCPRECFRPVALAWDQQGRLFFSSDATGEIWMIEKDGGGTDGARPTATTGGAAPSPGSTGAAVRRFGVDGFAALMAVVMGLPLVGG